MKRVLILTVAACLLAALLLAGCSGNGDSSSASTSGSGSEGIANPMVSYDSLEEAKEAMGYDALAPAVLPDGYARKAVDVIDGRILQIIYESTAGQQITYRTAEGGEGDISGDYNEYPEEGELTVGGAHVLAKGEAGNWSLALWENGGATYSLGFEEPVTEETLGEIIGSI